MSESPDTPVAVDRVDRARGDGEGVRLRLTGRVLHAGHADEEPLLVVQVQGRRHRFPADRDPHAPRLAPGAWEATFTVPTWAEPRRPGQAAVWLGNTVIPMPLPGEPVAAHPRAASGVRLPAPPALGQARAVDWRPALAVAPPLAPVAHEATGTVDADPGSPWAATEQIVDTGRTGPLAELLFKENVGALHAELEQRSAEAARLRGALADAQSQLTARATTQAALEVAQAELRSELKQLLAAAGNQQDEFDRRLREAEVERERLRGEVGAERERLRGERDAERGRLAGELDAERARVAELTGALNAERARGIELSAELAADRDRFAQEVSALRAQVEQAVAGHQGQAEDLGVLREQLASTQVAREASAGEVEGLRAELERLGIELAVAREQLAAQGGDLGEAQRLLADARAMTEQLRGQNSH